MEKFLNSNKLSKLSKALDFSEFISKNYSRHPIIFQDLIDSKDLEKTYLNQEFNDKIKNALLNIQTEQALIKTLRKIRLREFLRIAIRDILNLASLEETMFDLSNFADACLNNTLSILYNWQALKMGVPQNAKLEKQNLVVLGMGKLGAYELNFSSDIDLIFAYPEQGQTDKFIQNDDFFTKLCRKLVEVISKPADDGFVFRIDLNLRPYGESGPIVMNFDSLEEYYQYQGREWERYAFIKARVCAGDKTQGDKLIKILEPFVYRRYFDYSVFESLREMKEKISQEKKQIKDNVKIGFGGIREIEFFGQIFQLIRGGIDSNLKERSIQKVLKILLEQKYIDLNTYSELINAYIFLRTLENRLQEYSDQQTHKIPQDLEQREKLAKCLDFDNFDLFFQEFEKHTKNVSKHFNSLLKTDSNQANQANQASYASKNASKKFDKKNEEYEFNNKINSLYKVWKKIIPESQAISILENIGYQDPYRIIKILDDFQNEPIIKFLNEKSSKCLDKLIPNVLEALSPSNPPDSPDSRNSPALPVSVLRNIINLIKAIAKRACYLSLLIENPQALSNLVKLVSASPWIFSFLTKYPVLLDELIYPASLYNPPKRADLEKELKRRLDNIDSNDIEYQMEVLRVFKQSNILRVAAADITDALPLMKVSDYLSDIAEVILEKVLEISWDYLAKKYKDLSCSKDLKDFIVVAYGKLGGFELGYASDLDLVFLHSGSQEDSEISSFFARLGQRVIFMLTANTFTGILYETDVRLRPNGSSGVLVSHIEAFRDYQINKAWTWEKQALIRARAIIGNKNLIKRFEEIRCEILSCPRDKNLLKQEIKTMRQKMQDELLDKKIKNNLFDIKQSPGGIVDIEFLVQYLVLLHANKYPELLKWTDNVRLISTLAQIGILDDKTAYFLRKAYLVYRSNTHKLSLKEKPAHLPTSILQKYVKKIWDYYFQN